VGCNETADTDSATEVEEAADLNFESEPNTTVDKCRIGDSPMRENHEVRTEEWLD